MTTVIYDTIHEDIVIENQLIVDLINTKEFQRLRHIKQLSTASFTFPDAEHTRFSHSVGVMTLAKKIGEKFEKEYPMEWSKEKTLLATVAGLLHDIGHGAFSHTFEVLFNTNHEEFTCKIICDKSTQINKVLEGYKRGFAKQVADVIAHKSEHKDVTDLISSQLDADRMDYLLRDCRFTGANYGMFDKNRIIRSMLLVDGRVAFKESALKAIEAFIIGRYNMYQQVYFHRTNRGAVVVLQNMLKRAKDLYATNKDYFRMTSPRLIPFFDDNYDLNDYLALDDHVMMAIFALWQNSGDTILSELAYNFYNRILPTSVIFEEPESDLDGFKAYIKSKGYDINYFTEVNKSFDLPYDVTHLDVTNPRTEIKILTHEGLIELSQLSKLVKELTATEYGDKRFFFPKELLEDPYVQELTANGYYHPTKLRKEK